MFDARLKIRHVIGIDSKRTRCNKIGKFSWRCVQVSDPMYRHSRLTQFQTYEFFKTVNNEHVTFFKRAKFFFLRIKAQ